MSRVDRRRVLETLSLIGIGTATFQRALSDEVAKKAGLTLEQITHAEWVAGITLTDEQRTALTGRLNGVRDDAEQIQKIPIQYDSLPSFRFDPEMADPAVKVRASAMPAWLQDAGDDSALKVPLENKDPAASDDLSFLTIRELGSRLRAKAITAVQLAEHCLKTLEEKNATLNCVVTLTRDLAMKQAERADKELASGHDRGPLHGVPWGAKDLISIAGYPTTWGAPQFRDQQFANDARVAQRLDEAGAVLVAKLSLGALAMGDKWFNGQTKNPWNLEQGSSGSSAGSGSAVAAGLVPFAIGSETLGSIVSPGRRCGIVGLRPTFGRVSRAGCMALSWTMDKIGPMARTADDCGTVLAAIHGRDDADPTTVDRWFHWPVKADLSKLRIGRVTNCETSPPDQVALDILKELGATIVDIELPRSIPDSPLSSMLDVEAACIFQPLTRTGNTEGLNSWGDIFKASHFVSAVDYLQASRARFELMKQMARVFSSVDLYVGGDDLGIANLTGHPCMTLPVMMADMKPQPRPLCCTMTSGLYDEATLLSVARLIESKADVVKHRPQ
jgi:Asp-tRNA(Asn)/Glu-tRNA(Gln) amidotransferase A subunit family amidase